MSPEQLRTIQSLSVLGGTKPTTFVSEPVNDGVTKSRQHLHVGSRRLLLSGTSCCAHQHWNGAAIPLGFFLARAHLKRRLRWIWKTSRSRRRSCRKASPRLADLLNISDLFEDVTETWLTRWLPAKPTLLYMYDVIARSQTLVQPKRWWVLIPSGYWRVAWGYIILGVSSADVFRCGLSLAFCQAPYVSFDLYVLQTVFLIDMILKFISAYPRGGGLLEIRADKIALNYLKTQFIVDITALAPLELWLTPCWPDNTADPTPFRTSFFALPTYVTARTDYSSDAATECYAQPNIRFLQFFSWQWLHLIRWFFNWSKCNGWRSITSTENDGIFEVIKYMALMVMVGHVACCLNFWASFNSTGLLAPICSYRDLGTLPWDYVSRVLRKHNALDPFSQLLVDESESLVAGSPRALLQPGGAQRPSSFRFRPTGSCTPIGTTFRSR